MASEHIPGVEVGIFSRGQILLAKGYGLADVELNVPVKPETVFQSGSVGKQFVSAAVIMLVEKGKIGLDDSIMKYFPDAPASWKPILVKNLLPHTSGLAEYETPDRKSVYVNHCTRRSHSRRPWWQTSPMQLQLVSNSCRPQRLTRDPKYPHSVPPALTYSSSSS